MAGKHILPQDGAGENLFGTGVLSGGDWNAQGRRNRTMERLLEGILLVAVALLAFDLLGWLRPLDRTSLPQAFQSMAVPANTWVDGPIMRANGYSHVVIQFTWLNNFQMRNNNNYSVEWFDDAHGTNEVGVTQFGEGVSSYQNLDTDVIAPYFRLEVKNTDIVAHNVNAWAYLISK